MNLIESIKYENGKFAHLQLHEKRMNFSRKKLFSSGKNIDLLSALSRKMNSNIKSKQTYKCRVVYEDEIKKIEFIEYSRPLINSLKLVYNNEIDYSFKYEDRSHLSSLFAQRENCDDILIVKNNLISDTYFCNIVLFNGKQWLTPEKPLLNGIQRQFLIHKKLIHTAKICPTDLKYFSKARLINAMLDLETSPDFSIHNIK
ncbi:MAG: hypothetical protein C0595_04835 [Marinilabiliales bacterium]|nr:MAG: hypothetical protein C0595_04835 [Marinilabiliales bacterium]